MGLQTVWRRAWITALAAASAAGMSGGSGAEPTVSPMEMPRVPAMEVDRAVDTFQLRPGFHAEVVAAEPLVTSPVAVAVDERGRAYVVEMRDYSERRPERLGRIRRLEDTDGDGRYDHATVFLDGLPWPTAVACWDGGIFIGVTPDIVFARDTDEDGVADQRETIFTGFAADYAPFATNQLNVQALLNSFQWGPDVRLHGATSVSGGRVSRVDSPFTRAWRQRWGADGDSTNPVVHLRGRDFYFDPRTLRLSAETGGGQHGMSFDDAGRKFVCSNSDHLQLVAFDAERVSSDPFVELPQPRGSIAADGPAAEVFRRSPDEPWRVLRTRWRVAGLVPGPVEGGGRASGYFTGATGTTIYRGDAYGPGFLGDAFIGDAGGNLVHRKKIRATDEGWLLVGERAADEQRSEFLASTDTWFRPVQFFNGPDGCLWVLDMYRETIEHPWSLPESLKAKLDLDSGRDRGRIWRLAPDGFRVDPTRWVVPATHLEALVTLLGHGNAWHRETAARLILASGDSRAVPLLRSFVERSPSGSGRIQALSLLSAVGALDVSVLDAGLRDPDPAVRTLAVRLASGMDSTRLRKTLATLAGDVSPWVRLELAFSVSGWPETERAEVVRALLARGPKLVQEAALHSVGGAVGLVYSRRRDPPVLDSVTLEALVRLIGRRNDPATVGAVIQSFEKGRATATDFRELAALAEGLKAAGTSLSAADPTGHLAPLLKQVREQAMKGTGPVQAGAVSCLVYLPWTEARGPLEALLESGPGGDGPALAVGALAPIREPGATELLLKALPTLTREVRRQAIAVLLRRPESTRLLLDALAAGTVGTGELSVDQVNQLRRHSEASIRDRSRELFGEPPASRVDVVNQFLPALEKPGAPDHGAVLFQERCATCHAFRGVGVALGPDLASVVSNGREKLLVSVLDPNREVAPNFSAWMATTRDGSEISGILVRDSESAVTLRQAGGNEVTVSRKELVKLVPEGRSLMPEGLESGLTPSDVADLLAWLTAGR
ncbi:MAG: c-type cytochrome [Verrucomicrobiales bacterium]|nr:c-type cytochrome [Verrucomicrobiales bacterium]